MKKLLTTVAVASALSTASFAASAVVDLSVGAGSISFDKPTVKFGDSETTTFSLELDKPSQNYMWAQLDHLIPIVPNIRIEQASMKFTGTATTAVSFNGGTVDVTGSSSIDLTHQDIIAYWGVPFSTWLPMIDEADFGIGVKQFDGALSIAGVATDKAIKFDMPYGYAKLHISPPFMFGIGLEAELKTLSLDSGVSFNETIYKLDWGVEAPIPVIDIEVGIEAGYRQTTFKADPSSSGPYADVDFTGIFFGVYGKFGI